MIHSNHARLWEFILDAFFLLLDLKLGKLMRDPTKSENENRTGRGGGVSPLFAKMFRIHVLRIGGYM